MVALWWCTMRCACGTGRLMGIVIETQARPVSEQCERPVRYVQCCTLLAARRLRACESFVGSEPNKRAEGK
eukprot:6688753-Prymnesium_polylepis.1